MQQITVRVPASTSNLGPGFDCLGVALRIYDQVTISRGRERPAGTMVRSAARAFFDQATLGHLTWWDALSPAAPHLWFFYALLSIYVVVVPMRHYAIWIDGLAPARRRVAMWAPVAALLTASAVITSLGGFWGDLRPINFLFYLGFAWVGYALWATFPAGSLAGLPLLLGGVALSVLATVAVSDDLGRTVPYMNHRCSVFTIAGAMGQFLLLLRIATLAHSPALIRRVHGVARLTLGIFIVHPLLILLSLWQAWAPTLEPGEWFVLPVATLLLFAASGAVAWLATQTARRLSGGLRAVWSEQRA